MRQAGIVASAEIVALNGLNRLRNDHENANQLIELLHDHPNFYVLNDVQSNIVIMDLSPGLLIAEEVAKDFRTQQLQVKVIDEQKLRMVTHANIDENDIREAANIMNHYFANI